MTDLEKLLDIVTGLSVQDRMDLKMHLDWLDELDELKNKNFAPPSDDDFLAALGPCGK